MPPRTCWTGTSTTATARGLALTGVGGDLTYAQLHDRVLRTAAALAAIGLHPSSGCSCSWPTRRTSWSFSWPRCGSAPSRCRCRRCCMRMIWPDCCGFAGPAACGDPGVRRGRECGVPGLRRSWRVWSPETGRWSERDCRITRWPSLAGAEHRMVPLPDYRGLSGVLAVHVGDDRGAEGRDAPARRCPGRSARTTGTGVLGIGPDDRCLSAAKMFFAYGLGNSLLMPLSVGRRGGPGAVAGQARRGRRAGLDSTARRCSSRGRRSSRTWCGRACPEMRWLVFGWRFRRANRCRPRSISGGPGISGWTSWTASA